VLKEINLDGLRVLEIGPGDIDHIRYWCGNPKHFVVADIRSEMLERATKRLAAVSTNYSAVLLSKDKIDRLPFEDNCFDLVVSFYSLEHMYPLAIHLRSILRVLKSGGHLLGAIPCEGGLAWGIGRYVTSRRWLLKNTTINPDKIICWEHPNFADAILDHLDRVMIKKKIVFWPFRIQSIDLNLIARFIYVKE